MKKINKITKGKMNNKVDSILTGFLKRLEKIESFAVEQFPDFCKELIEVKKVETQNNILQLSLITVPLTVLFFRIWNNLTVAELSHKMSDIDRSFDYFGYYIGMGLSGIISLVLLGIIAGEILSLRTLKAGPKTFVVNELTKMIKGKRD